MIMSLTILKDDHTALDIDTMIGILVRNGYTVRKGLDTEYSIDIYVYDLTEGELADARYRKIRTSTGDDAKDE